MFVIACEYCLRLGGNHSVGCPYYVPPKANNYCSICGEGIYDGEEYVKNLDGEYVHYDCLFALTIREILGWIGCETRIMEDNCHD